MDTQEIKLKISQEDDLYCPLDPDRKMLSEDVTAYLEKLFLSRADACASGIPSGFSATRRWTSST